MPESGSLSEEWDGAAQTTPSTITRASTDDPITTPDPPHSRRFRTTTTPTTPGGRASGAIIGIARGVDASYDPVMQVHRLFFRVERYDMSGNRTEPVAVELNWHRGGQVREGDTVEVYGRWRHGTLHPRRIVNQTTGAEIVGGLSRRLKLWLVAGGAVLVAAVVAFVLFAGSGGPGLPSNVPDLTKPVTVPDVAGMSVSEAQATLIRQSLVGVVVTDPGAPPLGTVTRTDPAAGSKLSRSSSVRLYLAKVVSATPGSTGLRVPALVGRSFVEAAQQLAALGLKNTVTYVASSQPAGTVIRTSPRPRSAAATGSSVTLFLSTGHG